MVHEVTSFLKRREYNGGMLRYGLQHLQPTATVYSTWDTPARIIGAVGPLRFTSVPGTVLDSSVVLHGRCLQYNPL